MSQREVYQHLNALSAIGHDHESVGWTKEFLDGFRTDIHTYVEAFREYHLRSKKENGSNIADRSGKLEEVRNMDYQAMFEAVMKEVERRSHCEPVFDADESVRQYAEDVREWMQQMQKTGQVTDGVTADWAVRK
jgi:hypothetical protein